MAVITVSREVGSGGDEVARRVCDLLSYRYFDKALMVQVAQEQGVSDAEVVDFSEDSYRARGFLDALLRRSVPVARATTVATTARGEETKIVQTLDEDMAAAFVSATVRALWARGQVVVVGRGGQAILRGSPGVLHVRVVAPLEDRIQRLMQGEHLSPQAARALIAERDRAASQYLRRFHDVDWADPTLYHLTLNSARLGLELAAELVVAAARRV